MQSTRMTIEARDFLLDERVDVPALQLQICDAMRKGGGIVSFAVTRDHPLTVIISPGVPVLFEAVETPASDEPLAIDAEFASLEQYLDGY